MLTEDGELSLMVINSLKELPLLEAKHDVCGIAIDMPLVLASRAERGGRECDRTARRLLARCKANMVSLTARKDAVGPSSIFTPPSERALDAFRSGATHSQVSKANADSAADSDPSGLGLSIQSYNIMPKIAEADDYIRSDPDRFFFEPQKPFRQRNKVALFECHPELAFLALKSRQLNIPVDEIKGIKSKKTLLGRQQRCDLLKRNLANSKVVLSPHEQVEIESLGQRNTWHLLEYGTSERTSIATDDLLDAIVCVIAAKRFTTGKCMTAFPTKAEHEQYNQRGLPMAIFV
jgi:predicted RNase H-like nuclease